MKEKKNPQAHNGKEQKYSAINRSSKREKRSCNQSKQSCTFHNLDIGIRSCTKSKRSCGEKRRRKKKKKNDIILDN